MMEIEFRGKRIDNGEWVCSDWVYGDYITDTREYDRKCDKSYILPHWKKLNVPLEVLSETVGQYTGHKDIKRTKEFSEGQKIFAGDIVSYGKCLGVVKLGEYRQPGDSLETGHIGFYVDWINDNDLLRKDLGFWVKERDIEIIGNKWDNLELLGGKTLEHDTKTSTGEEIGR